MKNTLIKTNKKYLPGLLNIAVPIMDSIDVTHEQANIAAAHLMSFLFDCDVTAHRNFGYDKGVAQECHEFRLAADRAEDAP